MKLNSRYREFSPEYCNSFGRPLKLKKSMYVMASAGRVFSGDLTNWLIDEAGFKQLLCQMSIYYKYAIYR